MKLYVSHSSQLDYQALLYEPLKQDLGSAHSIFFPHDPENIDTKSKDIITSYECVLAEVSYASTGQGIELGWASAAHIPIICLHLPDAKLSGSLKFVSSTFIEYSSPEDMITRLRGVLASL